MKLSIIIPVYNERATIQRVLDAVRRSDLPGFEKEVVVVDDGSSDGTASLLEKEKGIRLLRHETNQGKGVAVKDGFLEATGDILLIQDADLEYDPADYKKLLIPIIAGRADVVYGSRFMGEGPHRVFYVHHYIGNRIITFLSNIFTGLNLSDMETCYKAFRREVAHSFAHSLRSKRFGIEPEITAKVARGRWRVYEVGISYYGRTYAEGKKINWRDGLAALWHIIRFNLFP